MDAWILQALEGIRNPFLDTFFAVFTALGEELIIAAIIAVIYLCFSKRTGEQALVSVMTASCLTAGIKSAVRRSRPYVAGVVDRVDIDNAFVSTADLDADMSFPSGHATATSGFFATIAARFARPLVIAACALFTLLVMTSRVYLGVHYPSDVLTGLLIGTGIALLWHFIYHKAYRARLYIYFVFALLTLPLLFIERTATHSMFQVSAITLATAAGLWIENTFIRFADTKNWGFRLLRLVITALVAVIPFALLSLLPEGEWFSFLKYFATIFVTITAVPFLIKKLEI